MPLVRRLRADAGGCDGRESAAEPRAVLVTAVRRVPMCGMRRLRRLLPALLCCSALAAPASAARDVVIAHARLIDGTGAPSAG